MVFVNATAVTSGRPRIFHREDLSHEALLASACLPQLFRAVEIDGVAYWDGGYSGNPALWPLIYETPSLDIVLVKTDPLARPGTPDTAPEIQDRVNEITFNAVLAGEMRASAFVQKLHEEGRIDTGHYKNLRLHMVADEAVMAALSASSKLDTRLPFLRKLHGLGRAAAEGWGCCTTYDMPSRACARRPGWPSWISGWRRTARRCVALGKLAIIT